MSRCVGACVSVVAWWVCVRMGACACVGEHVYRYSKLYFTKPAN